MVARPLLARLLLTATALAPLVLTGAPAAAQAITGPADASRVQERLTQPSIRQPGAELVEVEGPAITTAPAGADKVMLNLAAVALEGVSVYDPAELAPLYQDKIGTRISVADVYTLAAELTRHYRNDGFILTQVVVPPQTIEGGQVKLQVVEGFISEVLVEGTDSESERKLIASYAGQLRSEPLNARKLEQALLLVNDLPGVTARSIIGPDPRQAGAALLRIQVVRDSFEGQVSADNYGSRFLGPLQLQTGLSLNSFLDMNERITADFIYAPGPSFNKELAYGGLTYLQPIGRFGTTLELAGSLASSNPGYTLDEFRVIGRSITYSVKVNQPLLRTRAQNIGVYGRFDVRNNRTQSNIDATREDFIRAVRLGTDFDYIDRAFGGGFNSFSVEMSQGLSLFGASDSGDANLSRAEGDPQFTKFNGEAQRLQRLTRNLNLLVGVRGQYASEALLSSEEFGVGGPNYGRGYDPSEIVGDHGVAGKLELQWTAPIAAPIFKDYQLYAFLDGGRVWNEDATAASDKVISVASTGVGVRATLLTDTQAGAYVALPLSRDVQTMSDKDPRFFANVQHKF